MIQPTPPWESTNSFVLLPPPTNIILDLLPLQIEHRLWIFEGRTYRLDEMIPDQFQIINYLTRALVERNQTEGCLLLVRDLLDNAEDDDNDDVWIPHQDTDIYVGLLERVLFQLADLLRNQFIQYGMYDTNGWLMYDLTDLAGPWAPVYTFKFRTEGYLPPIQHGLSRL